MEKRNYPNLRAEMARHGETMKDLAELLNISLPTISRRFTKESPWTIGEIEILCSHYKKDYYELFK